MSWLTDMKSALLLGLLVTSVLLACNGYVLSDRLETAQEKVKDQAKDLEKQAKLITTMQDQDTRNRTLMADQQQKEQALRQQGETYQRKYRDAIEGNGCAAERMPDGVFDLLRQPATAGATTGVSPAP